MRPAPAIGPLARAVVLVALLAVTVSPAPAQATDADAGPATAIEEVVVHGQGGVRLRGLLVRPSAAGDGRPGVVLVHGAGPHRAEDYLAEAEAFARAGIVALAYDKRTDGYSMLERSYPVLADDAVAAVETVRGHPSVDPERVGVWGLSEGGWVAPLAATRSPDVAFVITIAGTGVPPAQQEAWAKANRLRAAGVDGSLLESYPVTATRWAVDTDLFAEASHDPVRVLEELEQPILAVWGAEDRTSPPAENLRIFSEALAGGPDRPVRLAVIPGAGHSGRVAAPDGGERDAHAAGYVELMTSWVHDLQSAEAELHRDAPPAQATASTPISPLAWWESPWILIPALGLALVGLVAYLAVGLVRRVIRRDAGASPGGAASVTFALLVPVTVIGLYAYFGYLLMGGEGDPGPILAGRPVPWLILQLLALAGVVALLAAAPSIRRGLVGTGGWQRIGAGLLVLGAVAWLPWSFYWGLLVP